MIRLAARGHTVALGMGVLLAGCGDGGTSTAPGSTPTAPPQPQPPPQAVGPVAELTFATPEVRLREGATAQVEIRYSIRELAQPLPIRLTPGPGSTASRNDLSLPEIAGKLPAGAGLEGNLTFPIEAVPDPSFAEGDEVIRLDFVRPDTQEWALGPGLSVVIEDAPATPCPGFQVIATPPVAAGEQELTGVTKLSVTSDATIPDLRFAFRSYLNVDWAEPDPLNMNVTAWLVQETAGAVHHEMDVEWWLGGFTEDGLDVFADNHLRLAFAGGACGPATTAVCSLDGCAVGDQTPSRSGASR